MSTAPWHVDRALLAAYARGDVDDAEAFSVEAHLVDCGSCQAAACRRGRPDADGRQLAGDRGRARRASRRVRRGRADAARRAAAHVARLLAATPSLTLSWFGAVAVALAVAVAGAHQGERGLALFLCIAALAPVAGVAASFTRGLDPTHELGLAAPMSSVRLLLLRTVAVLGATLALTAIGALALPGLGWTAAAWLLPALGLTLASLALATYVAHTTAFATVTGIWLAATIAGAVRPE